MARILQIVLSIVLTVVVAWLYRANLVVAALFALGHLLNPGLLLLL